MGNKCESPPHPHQTPTDDHPYPDQPPWQFFKHYTLTIPKEDKINTSLAHIALLQKKTKKIIILQATCLPVHVCGSHSVSLTMKAGHSVGSLVNMLTMAGRQVAFLIDNNILPKTGECVKCKNLLRGEHVLTFK